LQSKEKRSKKAATTEKDNNQKLHTHTDGMSDQENHAGGDAGEKGGEHLNIKVKSGDGNEVYFKVKKTTLFSKVMAAYCKKVGAEPESVRFLFDGVRIQGSATPEELNMEDEDVIDAMVTQTGGSSCC